LYPFVRFVRQQADGFHLETEGLTMKHNLGNVDRMLRAFVVAPLAIILGVVTGAGSVLGIVLFVVAAIMLGTAAIGFCPLYRLFGVNTCSINRRPLHH
jgi:hypothetical protein